MCIIFVAHFFHNGFLASDPRPSLPMKQWEGMETSSTACHKSLEENYKDNRKSPIISNSNWTEWSTIQGVIGWVISKSAECKARGRFEITSPITPWIVRDKVQLPINRNYNKIRDEYDSGLNYLTGLHIQLLSYMPKKKPFKCN